MKKLLSVLTGLILMISTGVFAEEKLTIEKQLVGIVGAISGTVKTETRELKAGDKIYLNETIVAGAGSGTQILLLDQSTFTIGEDSEVVMDTFIFDPATNDGKIVASVKQGSLKVISGLISKKNPDSLTVEVPEGTLGSRGTEFQTIVSKGKTDTLLIGPGKNNTLGMRPGAVLVGNNLGSTLLDNPYSMASMTKGKAPGQAKKITKNQLKKFNKKMKALRVAKLSPEEKKGKRKEMKKQLRKELKSMGFEKEEIKTIIRENIQKDKEKKVAIKKERAEKKKAKKKKAKAEKKKNKKKKAKKVDKKKGKKKKATKKGSKKKKAVKKKEGKKKKATKKKATKKKAVKKKATKKKKAVKKKPAKKKKAVKKKVKKKKVVKKKKKVVKKKKPKKKIKKKVAKKRKIVKKKRAAKKKKAKKKRRKKK
ncbi:FecR family protein [Candidatus Pelagibacter sp.]|uniref:FecR family protein n=1 Tax=Candidatus Pelagibacter sp. TaxID=2024849 RepID=UPI003F826656